MRAGNHVAGAGVIFDAVAPNYERPAQLFGLFQYRHWHRELARLVSAATPALVLDMCTGTGAIAAELVKQGDTRIVAADLSPEMLRRAANRPDLPGGRTLFVNCDAQQPSFVDGVFDAVVFSYLLRYVEDVPATIAALGALVRPGGTMSSLEFGVPSGAWHAPWLLYTRTLLPAGLAVLSPGWRRVGSFLGRSISDFYERWPTSSLEDAWRQAGFADVTSRSLSLGGAIVQHGTKG